jgi:hypothetical protein
MTENLSLQIIVRLTILIVQRFVYWVILWHQFPINCGSVSFLWNWTMTTRSLEPALKHALRTLHTNLKSSPDLNANRLETHGGGTAVSWRRVCWHRWNMKGWYVIVDRLSLTEGNYCFSSQNYTELPSRVDYQNLRSHLWLHIGPHSCWFQCPNTRTWGLSSSCLVGWKLKNIMGVSENGIYHGYTAQNGYFKRDMTFYSIWRCSPGFSNKPSWRNLRNHQEIETRVTCCTPWPDDLLLGSPTKLKLETRCPGHDNTSPTAVPALQRWENSKNIQERRTLSCLWLPR